jgi:membrane fusion protein, multidrug efflux system
MNRTAAGQRSWCLLLCLTAALPACTGKAAEAKDAAADSAATPSSLALPVVGRQVRRGDLVLGVVTTGQVRSDAVAELKFETIGTVDSVLVRPGQVVTKGAPLIRLDPRPFDLAVTAAQAQVDQAEMTYIDAIVPDSLVTGQPPTPERRRNAMARSGLSGARARLETARLDRERSVLLAPFDGIVDRVEVASGERVTAGQNAATVVDMRHLRIEAQVLEHDLPLIRVGGQAVVTTAAAPGRQVIGRIEAVLPLIDSVTRAGRALVVVPSGNGTLRPGMYADLRLEATRLPGRILLPSRAIIERDGRPLVFVVKNGRAQWVYVTPGRSNGVDTEILPDSSTNLIPVAIGDTVLIEGHLTLTHDAPVKLVNDR